MNRHALIQGWPKTRRRSFGSLPVLSVLMACMAVLVLAWPARSAPIHGALAVLIVSDPHQARSLTVEKAATVALHRLRNDAGLEALRLPIQVYRLDSAADLEFANTHLAVGPNQVPFVGLATVDADGLPTRFVLRYANVADAELVSNSIFSHALDLIHGNQPTDVLPPAPAEAGSPASDTMPALVSKNIFPPGVPTEIVTQPDNADMVLVPPGPFYMGSTRIDDEMPVRTVNLPAYYMDRYPVTNRQFTAFVAATGYRTDAERKGWSLVYVGGEPAVMKGAYWGFPAGPQSGVGAYPDYPVVYISWNDANAYALWAHKRLPSEEEWEKAARGVDARKFPWGNDEDESRSNSRYLQRGDVRQTSEALDFGHGPVPVGSLAAGTSPFGVMDMLGNVSQWVEDWYHSYPGSTRPVGEGEGAHKVLRGGGWNDDQLWCSYRGHQWPEECSSETGFRTCRDVVVTVQAH